MTIILLLEQSVFLNRRVRNNRKSSRYHRRSKHSLARAKKYLLYGKSISSVNMTAFFNLNYFSVLMKKIKSREQVWYLGVEPD